MGSEYSEEIYDHYHVRIGADSLFIETTKEVPSDSFDKVFIDITSTFGFWMGFSFFTVIEFLYFFFGLSYRILRTLCTCHESQVESTPGIELSGRSLSSSHFDNVH